MLVFTNWGMLKLFSVVVNMRQSLSIELQMYWTLSCDMISQSLWLRRKMCSFVSSHAVESLRSVQACICSFTQPSALLRLMPVSCAGVWNCFRQSVASFSPFHSTKKPRTPTNPWLHSTLYPWRPAEPSGTQYPCGVITFRSNNHFF